MNSKNNLKIMFTLMFKKFVFFFKTLNYEFDNNLIYKSHYVNIKKILLK